VEKNFMAFPIKYPKITPIIISENNMVILDHCLLKIFWGQGDRYLVPIL
jgi:hypothetical protein